MNTIFDPLAATDDTMARLHERLAARAEEEHLLDVGYRTVDSPVGSLLLAATDRGLVRVAFAGEGHDAVLETLARQVSPRILRAPQRLDLAARELDEYFAGRRTGFDLALDLRLAHGFRLEVLQPPARDRLRRDRELRGRRGSRRQPARRTRGRHRLRHQPGAGRRALPPGGALRRHAPVPTAAVRRRS